MTNQKATPIDNALREFEAVEANFLKLERIWKEIFERIPDGIAFGSDPQYSNLCMAFQEIAQQLPSIDSWTITNFPMELNAIAQSRFDAKEVGEIECEVSVEESINSPGQDLQTYRFRFDRKRRELIRETVFELMDKIDTALRSLSTQADPGKDHEFHGMKVTGEDWSFIDDCIQQIDTLLGSSVTRPKSWGTLVRHLHFGLRCDLKDILEEDWPAAKAGLTRDLYDKDEPIPIKIKDLSEITTSKPKGKVATKLNWASLSDEDFERLIFCLLTNARGYENPQWLMKTNAPDKGRDLSVLRVITDFLSGNAHQRVIIQCKNWVSKSVSMDDLATLREQMKLWEPPRVDVCIVATSGRFTSDAVEWIEKNNQSPDRAMRIEMWPESHLERLLASHPALIANFRLK